MCRYPVRLALLLGLVILGFATPLSATSTLAELERRMPKAGASGDEIAGFRSDLYALIESNTLSRPEEYSSASALAEAVQTGAEHRTYRVAYELLLTAVAKGSNEAEGRLPRCWESLLMTLGRPVRLDFAFGAIKVEPDQLLPASPAPSVIRAVWRDPADARRTAKAAQNNPALQALVDADQQEREKDRSGLTPEQLKEIGARDHQRNAHVLELVTAGALHTAKDFANASLVMQHSQRFEGFQLAHELAVCALLLGDTETGRWLVAATYDRMLGSIGLDQRFATQFSDGNVLMEVDERGICDAERLALGCHSLTIRRGDDLTRRAEDLLTAKNFVEAEKIGRAALEARTKGYPAGAWQLASGQRVIGAALLGQKSYVEAERFLVAAYNGLSAKEAELPGAYKERIRQTAAYLVQLYTEMGQTGKRATWQRRVDAFEREHGAAP